ncbi:histidine kinase dimerization/phospho-acceptor domain-containing protein [uncultured Alteromonas sp.]|jgi:signal transduction histidine kinase|uniref:histidine kinase dimerization/phospho-acceptor domain-containing protein n=1 Tax=uncultured Alteromonas sp. TaxID=179113 RepID=UPI0025FBD87D|nr:histidine kinase dimerization/phospho-acceptor domain-containing protein [uncultured Alteromonas sp.]
MKCKGIQAQLFIAFGTLVLIIGLFYTRLSMLFIEVTQDIVASHLLAMEITQLESRWADHNQLSALSPSSTAFSIIETESDLPGPLTPSTYGDQVFTVANREAVYYQPFLQPDIPARGVMVEASELMPLADFATIYRVFLLSVSAAALILAILSTWFLASRLAKPIQRLSASIQQQSPDTPCQISGENRQDEIGELAQSFRNTYSELQEAWQRERDFTRDVSHELRTPITLLKNTLAINQNLISDPSERHLIEQATNTLQQTVEVLLALARKENLQFSEVKLLPVLEKQLLALYQIYPDQDFNADIELPANFTLPGNTYLITLLCQNLINNGFYHGGGGMRIYLQQTRLVFENPLTDAPARPYYQGLGHGQYLVQRIASVMHWQVSIEQSATYYRVLLSW